MSTRTKNIVYSLLLALTVFIVWRYRQGKADAPILLEGKTMGTTYHVTYFDPKHRNLSVQMDSILKIFSQSLSTYIPDSEVSRFNLSSGFRFNLPFFRVVLTKSDEVVEGSRGAFDPTVMPLVNAWGFGPGKNSSPDSLKIDSIRKFVGFDHVRFNEDSVWKTDPRTELDFSAIAKGYGVDEVANLLSRLEITNYFVEIGGEVITRGRNIQLDKPWQIGILSPNSSIEEQSYIAYASLENKSIATSGNYFNYREVNGRKYSHTISPFTGYPIQQEILSASVFASDCTTADAWATAFMVLGHERAIEILEEHPELDAFIVYSTSGGFGTYISNGAKSFVHLK